jgi:hypothetical protein
MCALTYRRIEEIQEIPVLEEDSQPQPRTAVPQSAPKGEHKILEPLPGPRPLKPQNDDDDISRYSRVQIIDTSFQIQKAGESKIAAGIATLSVQDLDDPERLAAYLATVCGLPEEDCLVALRECETQLLAIRAEFEQSLANDVEGMANVFIDDESSFISRTRRWQSSVEQHTAMTSPSSAFARNLDIGLTSMDESSQAIVRFLSSESPWTALNKQINRPKHRAQFISDLNGLR